MIDIKQFSELHFSELHYVPDQGIAGVFSNIK